MIYRFVFHVLCQEQRWWYIHEFPNTTGRHIQVSLPYEIQVNTEYKSIMYQYRFWLLIKLMVLQHNWPMSSKGYKCPLRLLEYSNTTKYHTPLGPYNMNFSWWYGRVLGVWIYRRHYRLCMPRWLTSHAVTYISNNDNDYDFHSHNV